MSIFHYRERQVVCSKKREYTKTMNSSKKDSSNDVHQ